MNVVAVIPARGGSKRIPNKNIRPFAGKPIITYSIEAATQSGLFDRIVVSTDSDEIARVAEQHGAEAPFRRPANLCDDHTPTAPVIEHAIEWLREHGGAPDYVCCIYATAPFVRSEFLREGFETLRRNGASSVFSVTSFPFPIFRALRKDENGRLSMFWPEHELTRSQDLPAAYHDAGQFYWVHVPRFLETKKLYAADAMSVLLPRYLVQDIDTPEDWETAEILFQVIDRRRSSGAKEAL
ncbi:MAG: pseudaminic acid cytidylyltransferase [Phycisphaerae bacterium]|nr:pseudaminic acid cytidylyltransferase [Phycisphaerae bacterium]